MPEIRGCLYNARGHTPALAGGARELRVPALEKSVICDREGYNCAFIST